MNARLPLALLGLALLLAGTASAAPLPPVPGQLLNVVYHSVTAVQACAALSVQGSAGVGFELGVPPSLSVGVPTLVPPSPDCLLGALP